MYKTCYAKGGPLAIHWRRLSEGTTGMEWGDFCDVVAALPQGQLWRHNQAGDLPGEDGTIDIDKLQQLVEANSGKNGFTYTHKPRTPENIAAIQAANAGGFTINLSCDALDEVDAAAAHGVPVCVVVPTDSAKHGVTPGGNKWAVCPAQLGDITCEKCKLCQRRDRGVVVAFRAHGRSAKSIDREQHARVHATAE